MTADELVTAIRNVVAYALPDEERDAEIQEQEGNGTEGHIVHDLRKLAKFAG